MSHLLNGSLSGVQLFAMSFCANRMSDFPGLDATGQAWQPLKNAALSSYGPDRDAAEWGGHEIFAFVHELFYDGGVKRRLHIALLIETSNAYARGLLHGIRAYMRETEPWSIYVGEHTRGDVAPKWLRNWKGDGIIARVENQKIADAVAATRLPVVDVSAAQLISDVPYVETDDQVIAQLAAEHLLSRGFMHFGYCGVPFRWSQNRREWFVRAIEQAGRTCDVYLPPNRGRSEAAWEREQAGLGGWLEQLSKPVGVMAAYDIRGRQVLDACRERGIKVPYEVAVIGVDDDELVCELADPPLSSVAPDANSAGYQAAQLLHAMINGQEIAPGAYLHKPLGIVTRKSTDILATADVDLSTAVRFIREHACDGINVADVLENVAVSRRVLEVRFKELLGLTPHEEIIRVQVERVKQLLAETELPLRSIARLAGFKHVEYMSVVFKRTTGEPPSTFRDRRKLQ